LNGFAKWENIKHFKPDSTVDNWGDAHEMDFNFLCVLDSFRSFLNVPLYVVEGYHPRRQQDDPNHLFHSYGCAAKIVCPDYDGHILDLFFDAICYPFSGIGIYPELVFKNEVMSGLQVDLRRDAIHNKYVHLWLGYKKRRRYRSTDVSLANLKAHGIL